MKKFKRITAASLAMVMCLSSFAYAASGDRYLSLGADLSSSQKETVLKLLGVSNIDDCNVSYVTNAEEHQYLDGHVSSAAIGTNALSSVLIEENSSDDINVCIYNINYCTEGMYKNALATAGVKGADVVVAGPYEISGTAALVGTIKLYEKMTGEDVSDDVIDGSVEELTTTGDIGEEVGDKSAVEEVIASVKEDLADNPDMSASEIEESIKEAADKAGISLSQDNINKIRDMLQKLQDLDIDWSNVKNQSASILKDIRNALDTDEARGFFAKIVDWVKSFF